MIAEMKSPLLEKIQERVAEVLEGTDAFLVDLALRGSDTMPVIEVFVDTDAGISVEECARISRRLFERLEKENDIPGNYRLDVSSPGVDRPLKLWRQYPRHVGRKMRVDVRRAAEEQETLTGTLKEVFSDRLVLEVGHERMEIPFDRIIQASVLLPW